MKDEGGRGWPATVNTDSPDYDYWGLLVSAWDLLRGDTSQWPDREFYLRLIEKYGQPVLDVGCAAGRLLLDYAEEGIDIDGLDVSPEMVALCQQNVARRGMSVTVYEQSMADLRLPRKYRTILVPSSSFQLLTTREEAEEAMGGFRLHLEPGGGLAMPFMVIWREGEPVDTGWRAKAEAARPEDGAVVRRWSRDVFDPEERVDRSQDRFEVVKDGKVLMTEEHQRSFTRWYSQEEALGFFRQAGFVNLRTFRGFSDAPARL